MSIIVSHSIHLDIEQRQRLQTNSAAVDVIGVSLPVMNPNEPAEEVFCKYTLIHSTKRTTSPLQMTEDGYIITFTDSKRCHKLMALSEGGSDGINLIQNNFIDGTPIIHQICISTLENLLLSIRCDQSTQTPSK